MTNNSPIANGTRSRSRQLPPFQVPTFQVPTRRSYSYSPIAPTASRRRNNPTRTRRNFIRGRRQQ